MEEGRAFSAADSDLLLAEDEACLDGAAEEYDGGADGVAFVGDSALWESEEYVGLLVSSERCCCFESGDGNFSSSGSYDSSAAAEVAGEWLKSARAGAVRWILKTRAYLGFSLRTASLSVIHLDRFLLLRTIDALEWRMSSVTPFPYLNYFVSKLGGGELGARGLFYRAIALIFATVEASGQALTRGLLEDKMRTIAMCGFIELDQILSRCRVMVQELQKRQMVLKLGRFFTLPAWNPRLQSTISHSSSDAIDDPHVSSASCKRIRMALSSYSCSCSASNKNHAD